MKTKKDYTSSEYILSNFLGATTKYVIIVASLLIVSFPLYWLIISAFKLEQDYLAFPPILLPLRYTLNSFTEIFTRDKISVYFFNSMLIGIVTTLFVILVGSMAAFALVRGPIQRRAKNAFGVWFLIQKMYPAIATAIPVYLIMRKLRLMDTPMALIIMNTSFNLPLVIWLMMGFLEQIPYSLEESAVLDGCSFTGRFFMIVWPITKPGVIFVATWNEFLFAVILSIKRAKTLPVIIAGFITDRGLAWGPMAATAVLCLLPVIILTLAVQKDFVNGLAMGAVKG